MQNQILFRGKREKNDIWVEGFYVWDNPITIGVIHNDLSVNAGWLEEYEIIPETLSQYINLNYMDGRQAFTGDLFRSTQNPDLLHRIWFSKGGFVTNAFQNNLKQLPQFIESLSNMQIASWFEETCYYVGNVFDNPELVEGD